MVTCRDPNVDFAGPWMIWCTDQRETQNDGICLGNRMLSTKVWSPNATGLFQSVAVWDPQWADDLTDFLEIFIHSRILQANFLVNSKKIHLFSEQSDGL